MDLDNAINTHAEWKVKFRLAIANQETLDADSIARDNNCDMGKWIYGEAKSKYGTLPSYIELVSKHAHFHKVSGHIAGLINDKKYDEATALIAAETDYADASKGCSTAILQLKRETGL